MSARVTALAVVPTERPLTYLRQLCKTFGQRCESSFGSDTGYVEFGFGRCELRAAGRRLMLTASAWEAEDCARVRRAVTAQLERFGRRDRLQVLWR